MAEGQCQSRVTRHNLTSTQQAAPTIVRVLEPTRRSAAVRWPVVYVLPVEAGDGKRWGDPLKEVKRHGLDRKYDVIWAFPTFADLPWYANHPTNTQIRQESYFLKDVLPLVEARHGAMRQRSGRFLLGFSKSGWGAWSLLLRNPQTFERAAAWDAPMMMDSPGKYGSGPIFATNENFAKYHITKLLESSSASPLAKERLILTGLGNFAEEHDRLHSWMYERNLPHIFEVGLLRRHHWNSGWVPLAASKLFARFADH